jgi:hypothetical protein
MLVVSRRLRREKPAERKGCVNNLDNELPELCTVLRKLESTALLRRSYEGGGCLQRLNMGRVSAQVLVVKGSNPIKSFFACFVK